MIKTSKSTHVPPSYQDLFQTMFGSNTKFGISEYPSDSEIKNGVKKILTELEKYLGENVHADPLHQSELKATIKSAQSHINQVHWAWWPGVFADIVRLLLLLMGDLPTNENYSKGRKDNNFYKLDLHRSVCWTQNNLQKKRMLSYAEKLGKLDKKMWELRKEFQENSENTDFLLWFREKYPTEYAKVF